MAVVTSVPISFLFCESVLQLMRGASKNNGSNFMHILSNYSINRAIKHVPPLQQHKGL